MPSYTVDGVRFHYEVAGDGPPLLLLHGFTGSSANWQSLTGRLSARRTAILVDLIGHGQSDAPASLKHYRLPRVAEDLAALLDHMGISRTDVLGYSMGGRVALHLAVHRAERVTRLVLESASPGLADPAQRTARVRSDEALAARIERDGVAAFVDVWQALPLFETQRRLPEARRSTLRAQRLQNSPRGLANSLRGMGSGAQASLWDELTGIQMPVLLLTGQADAKFCAIAGQMAAALREATLQVIPAAGHAVHLEQPDLFCDAVLAFLADHS